MQLDSQPLPSNLYWADEFAYVPVAQSKERSVSGGMVVEVAPLLYGQKITLTGSWADRVDVLALRTMQAQAATVRTLTLNDGSTHAVLFDIEAGGVDARLLSPELNPTADTVYELTLHFITVEPNDGD